MFQCVLAQVCFACATCALTHVQGETLLLEVG